jgi:hypothetical protein
VAEDYPVRLDLSEALGQIDQMFSTFVETASSAAADAKQAILDQLSTVDATVDVQLGDPAATQQQITDAVAGADAVVTPDIDTAAITDQVASAAEEGMTQGLETGAAEADVTPSGGGGGAGPDPGATDDSTRSLLDLAGAAKVAETASGALRGEASATTGALSLLGPQGAAASGAVAGLAAVMVDAFHEAEEAQVVTQQVDRTFGAFAGTVRSVNFDGFKGSLQDTTVALGADDDALQQVTVRLGSMGLAQGQTQQQVAQTGQAFQDLVLKVSALHPELGTADEIAQRLMRGLVRGGPILTNFGLSWNQARLATELAAQGIDKTANELSAYDKITIASTALNRDLGNSYSLITDAQRNALVQTRSFQAQLREAGEAAGGALLQPLTKLGADIVPVLTSGIRAVVSVGRDVAIVLDPILHNFGPPLKLMFEGIALAAGALAPIFQATAVVIRAFGDAMNYPVRKAQELVDWIEVKLPGAFHSMEAALAGAVEPIVNIINGMIEAFNKLPFVGDIGRIDTSGLDAIKDGATGAGDALAAAVPPADDLADSLNVISDAAVAQVPTWRAMGEAQEEQAQGAAKANAELLSQRGYMDAAFFAMNQLGDRGPTVMRALAVSFQSGGLSMDQFRSLAERTGLSMDQLTTLEQDARSETNQFEADVSKAIGGITEAAAGLDDEGRAHIRAFITEMQQQAEAAATFSSSIQTLFARGADDLANTFLQLGPKYAGAAKEAANANDDQLKSFNETFAGIKGQLASANESLDAYAAHATTGADTVTTAFGKAAPAADAMGQDIDTALTTAQAALDGKAAAIGASASAIGAAIMLGVAGGIRANTPAVEAASSDSIDAALLAAQAQAGIRSPSKVFHDEVGQPIVDGIAEGISSGGKGGGVDGAVEVVVDDAVEAGKALGPKGAEIGQAMGDAVADGVTDTLPATRERVAGAVTLFGNDVGIPLTEELAQAIKDGAFKVDDAVRDVIDGAQQQAANELQTAFGALRAGRSLADARNTLTEAQQKQADLQSQMRAFPGEIFQAQQALNRAMEDAARITAREQQSIQNAQRQVDEIRASLAYQTGQGPQDLDQARRVAALDTSEADRLRGLAQEAADNATLAQDAADAAKRGGSKDAADRAKDVADKAKDDAQAAKQAYQEQQRQAEQSAKAVDDLTKKLQDNRYTSVDLQVAVEDLAQAQADSVAPTEAVRQAQQDLKDLQDKQVQTSKDLDAVTRQLPDAYIGLLEATFAAGQAGDKFNRTGQVAIDRLSEIGHQAGLADGAIQSLAKTWGGLASQIGTNLGGGSFGAPAGQIDVFNNGQVFANSPEEALADYNFVQGIGGGKQITMDQAPWNVNIYQANDPIAVAEAVNRKLGLAAVR